MKLTQTIKAIIQQFSDYASSHPAVAFVKKKETQASLLFDRIPKPVMIALHIIPAINLPASYWKEKGLKARFPEFTTFNEAKIRLDIINQEVEGLVRQRDADRMALSALERKRLTLEEKPKGLKGKISRPLKQWQCSNSKIKDTRNHQKKIQTKLASLNTKQDEMIQIHSEALNLFNAANTDNKAAAIEKERKQLKYATWIGLAVLTAATVAALALAAFSVIPTAIGLAVGLVLGASIGVHIALKKSTQWKNEGKASLETSS